MKSVKGSGNRLELKLGKETEIHSCIIQEDISKGERIRRYKVEAKVDGMWQTVCEGESVGHKRIQQFPSLKTKVVRLTVVEAVDVPDVLNFSVYGGEK